jgi:penicillin-insensitive murein DD-endopeptidase
LKARRVGLGLCIRYIRAVGLRLALLVAGLLGSAASAASTCYGTVANGRLERGVQLSSSGANFQPYSSAAVAIGRTFVHSTVRDIVTTAYGELEKTGPKKVFVYGEAGWEEGGQIRPHRTHRNGLSVDFMVPVLDAKGRSVPLPGGVTNRFGYDIEFDGEGHYEDLRIDFEAIAEHLYQLDAAARARGYGLALVIFDTPYLPKLFATKRGPYLKANLPFMKGRPWVRHDEHYHVDFAVPCKR